MATIGITGGTGFVGRRIARILLDEGHSVVVFTRGAAKEADGISYAHWNPGSEEMDGDALGRCEFLIHLAGAGVTDHRWTTAYKKEIRDSRVASTYFLHAQIRQHAPHCRALIAASATGIYGPDNGKGAFTENDLPYTDFLADICAEWETASLSEKNSIRTAVLRFGIVMGLDGGAWPKFAGPLKLGIMPVLGSGKQVMPWVHLEDVAQICVTAVREERYRGIYNVVSPNPVSQKAVVNAMAHARGRLAIPAPAPAFALRLLMGQSSIEVLKSTTVSADKIIAEGYEFRFPLIDGAMENLARAQKG
jgi:uncharacterized protein (TIGR01777 family)